MNERFWWLMRREWMQHRIGWIALVAVPLLVALLLVPVAEVKVRGDMPAGQGLAALALLAYVCLSVLIIGASVAFQAAGTARRDQQDRSVEFWMSLPIGPTQSTAATLLMHLLAMPVVLTLVSLVAGQLVVLAVLARFGSAGFGADLGQLAGSDWWAFSGLLLVRSVAGMVMATLWLSPVLLAVMAASVWLKRWGVPVVGLVGFLGSWLLWKITGVSVAIDALATWVRGSSNALIPLSSGFETDHLQGIDDYGAFLWQSTVDLAAQAASPYFAAGLVTAAGFFALLVWRRLR